MQSKVLGSMAQAWVPAGVLIISSLPFVYGQGPVGGLRVIEPGQPPVMIHPTVEQAAAFYATRSAGPPNPNLTYRGGVVETAPKIYLVLWGSQWNNNDPSSEASILRNFFAGIGGSSWLRTVVQYCENVSSGTVDCKGAGSAAGDQAGMLADVWADNQSAAPTQPTQSQLAAEALNAAQHFGNTTANSNVSVQYVIATATQNSSSGFPTQFCAWHSYTTSLPSGNVAYTNLPYITDAGANCGANFNGLGANAGITIVSGHEVAETITDQFPISGWLDSSSLEIGDKCAWIPSGQGAPANITVDTGTFAVQSLWSNAFNGGMGGCVLSYSTNDAPSPPPHISAVAR